MTEKAKARTKKAKPFSKTAKPVCYDALHIRVPTAVLYDILPRSNDTRLMHIPVKLIENGNTMLLIVDSKDIIQGCTAFQSIIKNLKAICKKNPDDKSDRKFAIRLLHGRLLNAVYAAIRDYIDKRINKMLDMKEYVSTRLHKSSLSLSRVDHWRKAKTDKTARTATGKKPNATKPKSSKGK